MVTTKRTSIIDIHNVKNADNLIILNHKAFWEPECVVLTIIYIPGKETHERRRLLRGTGFGRPIAGNGAAAHDRASG